jgi:hypothetical protein
LDECDGLPHRDKDIEKLLSEIHHNKREHLIVPPISSAASLVESALERKDSKHQTSSSSSNEHTTKKGVKLKKKGQRKQRPRSFVLSNGNSRNSVLNAELTQKLATLKKTRSGSDPVTVEMGKEIFLEFSFSFFGFVLYGIFPNQCQKTTLRVYLISLDSPRPFYLNFRNFLGVSF